MAMSGKISVNPPGVSFRYQMNFQDIVGIDLIDIAVFSRKTTHTTKIVRRTKPGTEFMSAIGRKIESFGIDSWFFRY